MCVAVIVYVWWPQREAARNPAWALDTLQSTWQGVFHTTGIKTAKRRISTSTFFFPSQVQTKAQRQKTTAHQFGSLSLRRDLEINTGFHLLSLSQCLESEAPRQSSEADAPAPSWPEQGNITFKDVEMRYRDALPLVLKKLSFTILPQETIGIVGRTGSGEPFWSPVRSVFILFLMCTHISSCSISSVRVCRKVLSGRRSVQTRGAVWRLHRRWRNRCSTDWSWWPAKQASHHSSRAGALHRDSQVMPMKITSMNRICNLRIVPWFTRWKKQGRGKHDEKPRPQLFMCS